MATETYAQIEGLIQARGGTTQQQQTGAAIVEAESGGNTEAAGDQGFGQGAGQYVGSEGMWQIFGQAHPEVSLSCAQDPACSTDAARRISGNWTNWSPWSTYNSGAYQQFLQSNVPPQAGGGSVLSGFVPNPVTAASDLGGKLGSLWAALSGKDPAGELSKLTPVMTDLGWRLGLFVLGAGLVMIGVVILFRPAAESAVKLAAKAI